MHGPLNVISYMAPWHRNLQVLKLACCSLKSFYVNLLVNVIIRVTANESVSFWEDIPQVCIKPTVCIHR
jgi:hypothetical protein